MYPEAYRLNVCIDCKSPYSNRPFKPLNRQGLLSSTPYPETLHPHGLLPLPCTIASSHAALTPAPPTVTRFVTSPPTDNCPQPKEALPAVSTSTLPY
jgi:hypothetical protein